jgi:antitoxin (DNA-binding transcriptional repressor) of toxin-antitoxin stability system
VLDSYGAERRPVAAATVAASDAVHDANLLTGPDAAVRDRRLAATLATPAQVLAAVEAGHELTVAYETSPIVEPAPAAALGPRPGQRVPDAGPLVRPDGSTTSLRELARDPRPQLWVCAGARPAAAAAAWATPWASALATRVVVVVDRPPPPEGGVELLADPTLKVHGRLGAVADTAYVVRPDGYLGARLQPPDAARLGAYLRRLGLRVPRRVGSTVAALAVAALALAPGRAASAAAAPRSEPATVCFRSTGAVQTWTVPGASPRSPSPPTAATAAGVATTPRRVARRRP